MAYKHYESELFTKQKRQLCKKDKPLEQKIEEAMTKILENPENHDSTLKGPRAGELKKKVIKERYRIIYRYCDHCKSVSQEEHCAGCDGQNSVIFKEVFHRDEGYD